MNPTEEMKALLVDAVDTVNRRGDQYGTPIDDFKRIAAMWNGLRNWNAFQYQPHDVAIYMLCLKLSRLMHSPDHYDNWLDIAGYAACGWACVKENDERQTHDDPSLADGLGMVKSPPAGLGITINSDYAEQAIHVGGRREGH